jgi:hypothetical protein
LADPFSFVECSFEALRIWLREVFRNSGDLMKGTVRASEKCLQAEIESSNFTCLELDFWLTTAVYYNNPKQLT